MSDWYRRNPDNTVTNMGPRWIPSGEEREATLVVEKTEARDYEVSTVFLYSDHRYHNDPDHRPVLWETLVFGTGPWDEYMQRYRTYDKAVAGHKEIVQRIIDSAETDHRIRDLHRKADDLRDQMLGYDEEK